MGARFCFYYMFKIHFSGHNKIWRFCFTSPQPVRPKEASDSVSTIRDVTRLTDELAVCFSLRTQCKRCSTGAYRSNAPRWLRAWVAGQKRLKSTGIGLISRVRRLKQHQSHGCPQKIFQGEESLKFRLSFLSCWQCNANGCSQNAIPFLPFNKNAPRYGNIHKKCASLAATARL